MCNNEKKVYQNVAWPCGCEAEFESRITLGGGKKEIAGWVVTNLCAEHDPTSNEEKEGDET